VEIGILLQLLGEVAVLLWGFAVNEELLGVALLEQFFD
jgi:hypothetical protein